MYFARVDCRVFWLSICNCNTHGKSKQPIILVCVCFCVCDRKFHPSLERIRYILIIKPAAGFTIHITKYNSTHSFTISRTQLFCSTQNATRHSTDGLVSGPKQASKSKIKQTTNTRLGCWMEKTDIRLWRINIAKCYSIVFSLYISLSFCVVHFI